MRSVYAGMAAALVAGAAVAQFQSGPLIAITERDTYRTLRVPVGAEIRARLTQSAGTPYRWEVLLNDNIGLIADPTTEDVARSGIVGGPQVRVFRIRVTDPGRFQLVFGLRSGAGQDAPGRERVILNIDAVAAGRPVPPPVPAPVPQPYDGPDTVEPLTQADERRTIDVPVGQTQVIALPSNPSTGYFWDLATSANVTQIGSIEEQRPAGSRGRSPTMVGGGGTALVRFRVDRPGKARLTMIYYRPGGQLPEKILNYYFRGI